MISFLELLFKSQITNMFLLTFEILLFRQPTQMRKYWWLVSGMRQNWLTRLGTRKEKCLFSVALVAWSGNNFFLLLNHENTSKKITQFIFSHNFSPCAYNLKTSRIISWWGRIHTAYRHALSFLHLDYMFL